jgi:hypothetical protein
MKRILIIVGFCAALAATAATPAYAQSGVLEFGFGWSTPVNDVGSTLSTGWNADFAPGRQFNNWLSLFGEFTYTVTPVKQSVLQAFQAPNGHGRIITLGLEPEIRFPVSRTMKGFVIGGVDLLHRNVQVTSPSTQIVDTSFGLQQVTILNVLSSESKTAIGEHFGAGVMRRLDAINADIFVQVRYLRAPTSAGNTALIPVIFGIRWTGHA